jgi:hypothetical protein
MGKGISRRGWLRGLFATLASLLGLAGTHGFAAAGADFSSPAAAGPVGHGSRTA